MVLTQQMYQECSGSRSCPTCSKQLYSNDYYNWRKAVRKHSQCSSCSQKGKRNTDASNAKRSNWTKLNRPCKYNLANKSRICPVCNSVIQHSTYHSWWSAIKQNRMCVKCNEKRLRLVNIGRQQSDHQRERVRTTRLGQRHSEATKCKLRRLAAERFLRLNIGTSVDAGAKEYFDKMNTTGKNIEQNKYFPELGYFADGYDATEHIWYEFDTLYHHTRRQKQADAIRQQNIVNHFTSVGKPLTSFVRVNTEIL